MTFHFDNKIFSHIPRTGGTYVRTILSQIGTDFKEPDHPHSPPRAYTNHSFCVIREPLEWYQSFYAFANMAGSWNKRRQKFVGPIPVYLIGQRIYQECSPESFEKFIQSSIEKFPHGLLSDLYSQHKEKCNHILRTETLTGDLKKLLAAWGYKNIPDIKKSDTLAYSLAINASPRTVISMPVSKKLAAKLKEVEKNWDK